MSLFSRGADTFYAFRFLRLLTTPWTETGAFKAGLIDKDGKQIKKPDTPDERSVYNYFHRLVFNVKRLINKVPLGKTTIASYLTALYLIKESTGLTNDQLLESMSTLSPEPLVFDLTEDIHQIHEGHYELIRSLPLPKTGELLATKGSTVIIENNEPIGDIFGFPIYEALHVDTNLKIIVNPTDLVQ